jgi:hypothetical protein
MSLLWPVELRSLPQATSRGPRTIPSSIAIFIEASIA